MRWRDAMEIASRLLDDGETKRAKAFIEYAREMRTATDGKSNAAVAHIMRPSLEEVKR